MSPIIVLDPSVGADARTLSPAPRLDSLAGKTIAFLDNGKPMADVFMRALGETLERRYGLKPVFAGKQDASRVIPQGLADELSAKAHGIVTGVGD